MSKIVNEVLAANATYVSTFGDKGKLAMPPARHFAILTCMDARLDPAKYAGLAEGDAHVFRNAGGRATDDAIRSLVISHKLLGTLEWFVIHHTNCGMELFSDGVMADLLEDDLGTAAFDGKKWSNPHHRGDLLPGIPRARGEGWGPIVRLYRSPRCPGSRRASAGPLCPPRAPPPPARWPSRETQP